jgi:hypothetical protein
VPGAPDFDLFIGIGYSGAETPTSRLKGLQVAALEGWILGVR